MGNVFNGRSVLFGGTIAMAAIVVFAAEAGRAQNPPAQVQGAKVALPEIAMPTDQPYDQLDADLHALVNGINSRLSAINDDMNQMRDRLNAMRPKPQPATGVGGAAQSTAPPEPPPAPGPAPQQKNVP